MFKTVYTIVAPTLIPFLFSTQAVSSYLTMLWPGLYSVAGEIIQKKIQQAGAELCHAQVKLEVIVEVVFKVWK